MNARARCQALDAGHRFDLYGKRHVTSGTKAINTVEDMKGFKLRIPEVDTFRRWPKPGAPGLLRSTSANSYLALSQGAVDGQENPLPTIQSGKFFEVQEVSGPDGHILTPRLIVVNEPHGRRSAPRGVGARTCSRPRSRHTA